MPDSNQTMNSSTSSGVQNQDERMFAMFCHLSALIGFVFPFGNIIAPLVIWILKKDQYPMVNEHGKESINFQINMTIYFIASVILIFFLIGIPIMIVLGLFELIAIVIAAVQANDGKLFRYPMAFRFLI